MTQRVEPDMTSVWVYDIAANGIGKVASASITAGPSAGYQRSFAYDTLTRPVQATVTADGTAYTFAATYDANSLLASVAYPSGLTLNYGYTSLGYALAVTDNASGVAYWTANARDAELRLTQQTAGNGVVTAQSFDAQTGRLMDILAGTGNIVQNFLLHLRCPRQRADPGGRQRNPDQDLQLRHRVNLSHSVHIRSQSAPRLFCCGRPACTRIHLESTS
jgi:YD repeat-containing protein